MARLIINADDLGYDPAITQGILEAMQGGWVTSATLMVNTPFSAEAATAAQGLRIGLHFDLAWGRPLSADFPEAQLEGGRFCEARGEALPVAGVVSELEAQLDRFERLVGRPATHLDTHRHTHRFAPVLEAIIRVATARRLPVRSTDEATRRALRAAAVRTPDGFLGEAEADAYWTGARLESELARLVGEAEPASGAATAASSNVEGGGSPSAAHEPTFELMCHPGYAPTSVRSRYSAQREVELETMRSEATGRALREAGFRCVSFAEL